MKAEPAPAEAKSIPTQEILDAIRKIAFGNVLVKVHQGKVVGYEVTEKKHV